MFTLPSSWNDSNTVEKDAKTANHPSIYNPETVTSTAESEYDKTNTMTCATSELYYQPWHPRSLIHRSLVTHKAHSDDSDQTGWMLRLILFLSGCHQYVAKDPGFLPVDSEDSDQTGRMPRLIWVFAGRTVMLLVLSCVGSFVSRSSRFSFSINHHQH